MNLIIAAIDCSIAAITNKVDYVTVTENGDIVTVSPTNATAVYDAVGGTIYRCHPAYPGDVVYRLLEIETVPEGVTPDRWRYVDGEFIRIDTVDATTMTQLAVAELAQTVEDNNTANQLAIAELAELMTGGVA